MSDEPEPKLSENVGALGCSFVLLVGGGLLAVSGWGDWAQIVGGIIALIGLITANATFWAIIKGLGRRAAPSPASPPPAPPPPAAPAAASPGAEARLFCPTCGTQLPADAKFCTKCGKSLPL